MLKNYFKSGMMLLAASAIAASASAGDFVDVSRKYMKDLNWYTSGWQGYVGNVANGVGEVWGGAFDCYQYIDELPAGQYTLSVDAFYRCADNDYAKANMAGNADLNTCFIYAGDATKTVKALFDGRETAPNGMGEAATAFANGEYTNELTFNHPGGTLRIGIKNTGCYYDEWACFDNFELVGPDNVNYTEKIINNDFSDGAEINNNGAFNARGVWESPKNKCPDVQKDGTAGGNWRKCGGSPYMYGQKVTLPAGKYRWGMKTFHRYGAVEAEDGTYQNHKTGIETEPYGVSARKGSDWYKANDYDTYNLNENIDLDYAHAFLMVVNADAFPANTYMVGDDGDIWASSEAACGIKPANGDKRVRIKDAWEICNGNYKEMPKNCPSFCYKDVEPHNDGKPYVKNTNYWWHDSGHERESGAAFVNEGDKYFQYVEFELQAPTTLYVGMGKQANTSDGYWQPWCDSRLMQWDESAAGVEGVGVDNLETEGPAEYYNMQGVRVAEPTTGLYIVKQGNKVSKQLIRK